MKIEIENDIFDIVKRLKEIDAGYFILYDLNINKFEVHNKNQKYTYCITYPYDDLDSRLLDIVLYSSVENIDNIVRDIDNNNDKIEQKYNNEITNKSKYIPGS